MIEFLLFLAACFNRFTPKDGATGCCTTFTCLDCCEDGIPDSIKVTVSGMSGTCPNTGNCSDIDGDYVIDNLPSGAADGCNSCSGNGGTNGDDCVWRTSEDWVGSCITKSTANIDFFYRDCTTPSGECDAFVRFYHTFFGTTTESTYSKQAAEDASSICSLPITLDKDTGSGCGDYDCTWPATVTVASA